MSWVYGETQYLGVFSAYFVPAWWHAAATDQMHIGDLVQRMQQTCMLGRDFLVGSGLGSGSGLRLSKCFGPTYKLFLQRRKPLSPISLLKQSS